jgi:hypothetical protein
MLLLTRHRKTSLICQTNTDRTEIWDMQSNHRKHTFDRRDIESQGSNDCSTTLDCNMSQLLDLTRSTIMQQ